MGAHSARAQYAQGTQQVLTEGRNTVQVSTPSASATRTARRRRSRWPSLPLHRCPCIAASLASLHSSCTACLPCCAPRKPLSFVSDHPHHPHPTPTPTNTPSPPPPPHPAGGRQDLGGRGARPHQARQDRAPHPHRGADQGPARVHERASACACGPPVLVLPPAAPCCPLGSSGVAPAPLHRAPPDEGRSGTPGSGGEARPLRAASAQPRVIIYERGDRA